MTVFHVKLLMHFRCGLPNSQACSLETASSFNNCFHNRPQVFSNNKKSFQHIKEPLLLLQKKRLRGNYLTIQSFKSSLLILSLDKIFYVKANYPPPQASQIPLQIHSQSYQRTDWRLLKYSTVHNAQQINYEPNRHWTMIIYFCVTEPLNGFFTCGKEL